MASEFFAEHDLNFEQVKAITHALFAVARVDGVHDTEMAMIREFYESCARAGDPRLEDLASDDFDPVQAKGLFETLESRKMFLKTLILLAFADGKYATAEDEYIRRVATEFDINADDVDALHEATKEYLLSGLTHIHNVEALRDIRKQLDPH